MSFMSSDWGRTVASGEDLQVQGTSQQDEVARRRAAWRRVPNRLFAFLVSADFFFVAIFALAIALGFARTRAFALVSLDVETNPPSWYSATQLFGVAVAFLMLGTSLLPLRRRASDLRRLWLVLGIGFTYLSMDEGAALHERMGRILTRVDFKISVHGGGQWIFFYLLLALLLGFFLRKEIVLAWRDWRPELILFIVGFMILASGGVGSEMVEWFQRFGGVAKYVEIGVEEGLEMLGASVIALSAWRVLSWVLSAEPDAEAEA
jgi:hypothetical protein